MKKNIRKAKKALDADLTALKEQVPGSVVIGMDTGDRHSELCVLDQTGLVLQRGRIRTEAPRIYEQFSVLAPQRVVMETGTHSPWLSALLSSCGHEVIVANARKLRLIVENDKKSDEVDAFELADLGRTNVRLLHPVKHRSIGAQQDLAMIRARESLVEVRTGLINHARGVVKSHGGRLPKCDSSRFAGQVGEQVPEGLRSALSGVMESLEGIEEEIFGYERRLEHLAQTKYPETALLKQVDGVGTLTALAFRLTIDDPKRFEESRTVGAYLGLVSRRRQSGERDPQLGISKAGDELLRKLLVNCAHYIIGPFGKDSTLRRWGLGLVARGGRKARKRAATAVARKLAVLLHRLWVSGEVYEPLRGCQEATEVAA
jgi:transposase